MTKRVFKRWSISLHADVDCRLKRARELRRPVTRFTRCTSVEDVGTFFFNCINLSHYKYGNIIMKVLTLNV